MMLSDIFFDSLQSAILREWREYHDEDTDPNEYIKIRIKEIAKELALLKPNGFKKLLKHKHAFRVELPDKIKAGEPMYSSTGHNQAD